MVVTAVMNVTDEMAVIDVTVESAVTVVWL